MGDLRPLLPGDYRDIVRRALEEDLGTGDVTTEATISPTARARGIFLVKEHCVLAGLDVAVEAFLQLDPTIAVTVHKRDGQLCDPGDEIATITGTARALLSGGHDSELYLRQLAGIAAAAHGFVKRAGRRITVLDARRRRRRSSAGNTVLAGAAAHRRSADAILIRDCHVRLAGVGSAIGRRRPSQACPPKWKRRRSKKSRSSGRAPSHLADNLSADEIRETVRRARGAVEISGGVTRRGWQAFDHQRRFCLGWRADPFGAGGGH